MRRICHIATPAEIVTAAPKATALVTAPTPPVPTTLAKVLPATYPIPSVTPAPNNERLIEPDLTCFTLGPLFLAFLSKSLI